MVIFPFANCGLCRPQRQAGSGGSAPAAVAPPGTPLGGPTQPASVPQMLRSKSEARILRVDAGSAEAAAMLRSQSMPSSTLLEASRRRLAAAEAAAAAAAAAQQMEEDGAAAKEFVHLYMKSIKDGNPSWASAPEVGSLFTEDARMVSADRQTFHGRQAIVRRLNQGVEQLARMAGDQPELPTFELTGPEAESGSGGADAAGPGGQGLVLRLALKRGLHRMTFTMHFTMKGGRIATLINTRS
ncbi:hypothetical protein ABPG77_002345 [Micractinium sp. CCAP 211/92]